MDRRGDEDCLGTVVFIGLFVLAILMLVFDNHASNNFEYLAAELASLRELVANTTVIANCACVC